MRIIFLNRFFHPDHSATSQMLSDLAFALAGGDNQVHVITSRQRYDAPEAALAAHEVIDGVTIDRVPTTRFGRMNLAGRAVDYLTFYAAAAVALWRLARAGDVVVVKTDPPLLSLVTVPVARLRRARAVNWLQDVFPEVATALGIGEGAAGKGAYRLLRWLRDRSLKVASSNVVLGDRMAAKLTALGVAPERIAIIPNWSDGHLVRPVAHATNRLRREWILPGQFVASYSGNLGRAHDVETILGAMLEIERAPSRAPVTWLLIGGGAQYEKLARDARQRGVTSLQLKPYQPRERLSESLSTADVHLISLRPELEGLIVPSKFYGVAAAGRASIYIGDGDGEIARTIKRLDAGLCVPFGDAAALAEAVLWLAAHPDRCREMGQRARLALEREFDKAIAVDRWRRLLSEIQGQCEVPTAERLRSPTNKRHDRSREPVQQKR